jgi:hypothetical protein
MSEEWPLTSRAIADSERAAHGDYDLDDDKEPVRGNALLHALAEEGLVREVTPGRFYVSKLES